MRKSIRSLVGILLAFVMLIPTALPVAADNSYGFVDFPTGWSAPAMSHAVANGLIKGKSATRIAPEDYLTRAEMATIINRAFGATVTKDISAFSDVSASEWYYQEIQKAYNMQTLYGDAGGTMRPDAPIIREEAIAIVARAMVLSGYSASNLDKFKDKGEISDWAVDPLASMAANSYVNGDEQLKVNPKANITREEFAQLIYNIIKHYYNPNAKSETYQGNLMLNTPDVSLENITVNGDLVLGDGVGKSKIKLTNINIKGRLLVRGAAQITLKNVTTGKGVVVKNVNGTVHFDNYRDEKVFDGVAEHTKVTYKKRSSGGAARALYTVEHYQEALDGSFVLFETESILDAINTNVTAVAKAYEGFTEDTANALRVPTGTIVSDGSLTLKLYYTRNSYDVTFNYGEAGGQQTVSLKYGAPVTLEAPAVAAPAGKYFAGWFDAPVGGNQYSVLTVPAGGVTIYAQWSTTPPEVVNFTVVHKTEGLDGVYTDAETETKSALAGSVVKAEDYDKTITGFTFNSSLSFDTAVLPDGTTVLEIYYTRNSYDVVFDYGEAGGPSTVPYKYGAEVDLSAPAVSAPAGKYFAGWFDAPVGGNKYMNLTVPVGGITIYAQWLPIPPTPGTNVNVTVEHYKQKLDGTYAASADESEAKTVAANTVLKAADYQKSYTGFTTDIVASPDVTAVSGAVLKIYYTRNTYTFTFDYDGATSGDTEVSKTFKYEEPVTGLPTPSKGEEFGFGGWYTGEDGTGTKIEGDILGTVITGDTTVYAYWIQKYPYTVKYLQENANDDDFTVVAGDTKTLYGFENEVVTVTNDKSYTGFYYDNSSVTTGTVNTAGTLVIELKFKRNTYTVTYNYGEAGGDDSVTLKYGQNVDLSVPAVNAPSNKYFAGWFDAPVGGNQIGSLTVPLGDVTIYAQWSDIPPVNFTVRHFQQNIADDLYPTEAFEEETKSAIPGTTVLAENFDKSYTGFTVDLASSPDVTVAADGNTILNIYYTRNTYTIVYNYGEAGGEDSVTLKYGATVDLSTPAVTAPADKTFAGWFDALVGGNQITDLTVPENGTTIYAQWSDIPSVGFVVKHFQQNIADDLYPAEAFEEETKSAIPGHTVKAQDFAKTYEGFDADLVNSPDVTVEADGSTILSIYYVRKIVTITFKDGDTVLKTETEKFGADVDVSLPSGVIPPAGKHFGGWYTAPNGGGEPYTSTTMGSQDKDVYVFWSDNPGYLVEYYQENADNDDYTCVSSEIKYDKVAGETAEIPAITYPHFTEITHANTVVSGVVTETPMLVLRRYFNRERYNVTYDAGLGVVSPSSKEYKYDEDFEEPTATREYYKVEGWYTGANGTGTKINVGDKAGIAFTAGTLYAKWEIDKNAIGDVVFTASVTDEDLDNDEFSILVDVSNNLVGISEYQLTLNWDNAQVKPILVGGKVVTDLNGLGGNAITTSADSVTTEDGAAALSSVTVNWNNATNVPGNANLFKVRFKITNTLADKDHETPSVKMFRMMRNVNIDGLMDLPFTITSVSVLNISDTGEIISLDNSTNDTSLVPYKIEHYKEKIEEVTDEDDKYALAYTEYGHDIIGNVIFISEGKAEYIEEGFIYEEGKSANKVVITANGAVIKLYYARPRFDVEFDYQGATRVEGPRSVNLKLGAVIANYFPEEDSFEKTDYNFGGWFTQPGGQGQEAGAGFTVPKGGIKLYANWVQTPYKVEHYQMELDGVNAKLVATEDGQAKAGTVVTATAKTYFGFDAPAVMPSETVAQDGSTVIKVYYTRKTYTIKYDFASGTAVGSYETTFKYGQSIPLAKAEKLDEILVAWTTAPNGGGATVDNTANIDHILQTLTGDVLKLYAFWVPDDTPMATFEVKHYKENLDGTYPETATETDEEDEIVLDSTLKVSEYAKSYEGFTVDVQKSLDVEVSVQKHYVLEIYYKRNTYTLNYNYSDADTTGIASDTFKYGQTITLPEEDTFSKEGFIFTGWYKTAEFKAEDLIDESVKIEEIVDVNNETTATIYAKWDQFFTVTFKELGILRHTSKVYPNISDTVPQADIDSAYGELVNPYIVGYRKDASVSQVYAENPYEHQIYGDWYYYENGDYILFTDKTVINKDLTVRYMFRKAGLELDLPKLSQIIEPTFEVPFESDTRVLDTLKDATFLFEEKLLTAFDALDAGDKFDKLNDKIVELLASKGFQVTSGRIFADDGEILKQHIKFNGFAYLDEAQLKSVVVNAIKTTFKNDPLRMRGVIDEMMQEQDEDVINLMDSMLLSMLSGSDSQRIKDIIAGAVEDAIANDTTGEFKTRIKNIIIAQLDAGNETVKNSVKSAVNDYFMSPANDDAIKTIVKDLIDQAYATDDDEDPIRKFVKGYITTYLNNNHDVLDDMIRDLGATLDPNNEADKYIIGLIEKVLSDNNNVNYLEELVDGAIADLHNMDPDSDLYKFIVGSIEEELKSDPDELAEVIRAIGKEDVEDIQPALETVLEDNVIFASIVTSALEDNDIFKKVISAALDNVTVFETIVKELCTDNPAFYNMLVDTAFSSTTLTSKVVDAVVSDKAALETVLLEAAETDSIKQIIIDKILEIGDETLKDTIKGGLGGTGYYDSAYAAAMEVVDSQIKNILVNGVSRGEDYFDEAYAEAMKIADNKIKDVLTNGVSRGEDYFDEAYAEAMKIADNKIKDVLTNGVSRGEDYFDEAYAEAMKIADNEIKDILVTGVKEGEKYYNEIYPEVEKIVAKEVTDALSQQIDKSNPMWQTMYDAAYNQAIEEAKADLADGLEGSDYYDMAYAAAYAKAETTVEADLSDGLVGSEYYDAAYSAAYAKAETTVETDLADGFAVGSDYYNMAYTAAYAKAETTVEDALTGGVKETDDYWDEVYEAAKSALRTEISSNFESQLSDAINDPDTSDQIKTVASDMLLNNVDVNATLKTIVTNLGTSTEPEDVALKESIINSVINYVANTATDAEKNEVINSIITELLKTENATLKEAVTAKAISVINEKGDLVVDSANNITLKESIIDSVIADVFADDTLKNNLIEKLVEQVQLDDNLKNVVIAEGIYAIVNDDHVNEAAIDLVNNLIKTDAEFKTDIVEHIVDYVLEDATVRAEAIEKVITKIESNDTDRNNAIEFAFNALKSDATERDKIVGQFLTSILGDAAKRGELATDVIDVMFDNPTLRNKILDIGFEQMFSSTETIKEIVKLALDSLISDNSVRRELILAVVSDETGRKEVLDLLFAELDRDPTFIDQMVEIAMKGKYGDMVDKFVYDLVNSGVIEINPDNRQIAEEIVLPMLDDMTLDTILSKLPAQMTDILPESLLETIFNKFKSKAREKLVEGIEEAKQGNSKDILVIVDNDIDVINSILIPAYNKAFPKVTDKAEDFYYYSENQYIRAIVDMLDPEYIFEKVTPGSEYGTGYRIRDSRYYYEMLRNTLVLADDAGQWYLDNISDAQIDKVISKFMSVYTKAITKANSLAGGRIPEDKLDTIISYVEKAIDKRQGAYDYTTNGAFEVIDKAYHKIIELVKEKIGIDLSTDTVIEVTFDGSELDVNGKDINIDNYKIDVKVKGYSFKLNSREITVGGKTVDISRFVQKIADKFGTKSVTIKFCEEVPYSYELSVEDYSVKVSAFYEG